MPTLTLDREIFRKGGILQKHFHEVRGIAQMEELLAQYGHLQPVPLDSGTVRLSGAAIVTSGSRVLAIKGAVGTSICFQRECIVPNVARAQSLSEQIVENVYAVLDAFLPAKASYGISPLGLLSSSSHFDRLTVLGLFQVELSCTAVPDESRVRLYAPEELPVDDLYGWDRIVYRLIERGARSEKCAA